MHTERRAIKAYLVPVPFAVKQLRKARISAKKIHIIPYPLSVHSIRDSHRHAREPFVLYAGRLSPEKGIETLIYAAQLLPDTRFVVVGSGPQDQYLHALCISLKVRNVEFTGFLERTKLQHYIDSARLIVVPSVWYDVSPYAVLEAQARAKAVLGANIGGIPDLIEEGKSGFLFPAGNAKLLAKRIEVLMSHPRLLDAVGRTAQAIVAKEHDSKAHYGMLMRVYEEIAAQ